MNKKSYFFGGWLTVLSVALCAGECRSSAAAQAQAEAEEAEEAEAYYTENPHALPRYSREDFQDILVVQSPEAIRDFGKKLKKQLPKWFASGTEPTPFALWQHYRQAVLSRLDRSSPSFANYCEAWGALLRTPNEATEAAAVEACKRLQSDKPALDAWRSWLRELYNYPERFAPTEAAVAYQTFIDFVAEKQNNLAYLNHKKLHANLKKWQEDGHPKGTTLWKEVQRECSQQLTKRAVLFQYAKNRRAVEACLASIDRCAQDPYCLSYAQLECTIPHGLYLLDAILREARLDKKSIVEEFQQYRKLYHNSIGQL